jgi:hypothetical protein
MYSELETEVSDKKAMYKGEQSHIPGQNAVLQRGKQIVTLVVRLLGKRSEKRKVQGRVALVSPSLLALAQLLAGAILRVNLPDGLFESLIALTVQEYVNGLIDGCLIVRKNSNGVQTGQVGKTPLRRSAIHSGMGSICHPKRDGNVHWPSNGQRDNYCVSQRTRRS